MAQDPYPKSHCYCLVWPKVPKEAKTLLSGRTFPGLRGRLPGARDKCQMSLWAKLMLYCIKRHHLLCTMWAFSYFPLDGSWGWLGAGGEGVLG